MREPIDTIMYRNHEIKVYYDESGHSPDYWRDDAAFLVYDHRNFTVRVDGFNPQDIFDFTQEGKRVLYDGYYVFPVYAYIHSGVSLSLGRSGYPFNCRFDTSMKGFALVQRMAGCYNYDKAYERAQSLLKEWNTYLDGDVYGYMSPFGSCWGFYGKEGRDEMIEEAKGQIDYHAYQQNIKRQATLKMFIHHRVPYETRAKLLPKLL